MQIKPQWNIISHLPEWLSSINQQTTSTGEDVEKKEAFCPVDGNPDWCSHCGKQYGDTSKIRNGFAIWSSNPTSGNIFEGTQNINSKEHKHLYVLCRFIYNCQDMEAAQVSVNRRVDKTTMGHLHIGILLGYKNEENFTLCNTMDGPGEHCAEWNKPARGRQIPQDFTHMWNLLNKLN